MDGKALRELYERGEFTEELHTKENLMALLNYLYSVKEQEILQDGLIKKSEYDTAKDYELISFCAKKLEELEPSDPNQQAMARKKFEEGLDLHIKSLEKYAQKDKHKTVFKGCVKAALAAAGIVLILMIPFQANGRNIFNTMVQWGSDILNISMDKTIDGNLPKDSIKNVPFWLPDGFVLTDYKDKENEYKTMATYVYEKGDNKIRIRISTYSEDIDIRQEINKENTEEYVGDNGTVYYFGKNKDKGSVTWISGRSVYNISGDISAKKLKKIINSF